MAENYMSIEEITELLDKMVETKDVSVGDTTELIEGNPKHEKERGLHIETLEDMLMELYEKYPNGCLTYERRFEHMYNK